MHWRKGIPGEPTRIFKDYNELMLKEKSLHLKERELFQKEVVLQRKIKEFKKRAELRAKADLSTAADLQEARRKLLLVLDKQKAQKRNKHNNKTKRKSLPNLRIQSSKVKKDFNDILYDFCEKLITSQCTNTRFRPYSSRFANMLDLNRNDFTSNGPYTVRNSHSAEDCYLMSLRKTPQMWKYRRLLNFYPHYQSSQMKWKDLGYVTLFFLGFLFWAPILICFEFLKCFFCACCCHC